MVKLKLVAGYAYTCPPAFSAVLQRGDEVEVSPAHAKLLLADSFLDALNNEHKYFAQVSAGPVPAEAAGDEEDDSAAAVGDEDPNEGIIAPSAEKDAPPARKRRSTK
jgi:hypothetical protein